MRGGRDFKVPDPPDSIPKISSNQTGKSINYLYCKDYFHFHFMLPSQPDACGNRDNYPMRHRAAPDGWP